MKHTYTLKEWDKEIIPLIDKGYLLSYHKEGKSYLYDKLNNVKYIWKMHHKSLFWRPSQRFISCVRVNTK